MDDALRERGVEPVDTPDVRDVNIEEGRPLTFTASFDTVPSFDPGDLATIALAPAGRRNRRRGGEWRLQRLRDRAARHEPVEGRGVDHGDTVTIDLERRRSQAARPTRTRMSSIELGAKANPPGFDDQLLGLETGATKSFTIHYPQDYPIGELAGTDVAYTVKVNGLKRRVLPELDDEFAKDLGEFDYARRPQDARARGSRARGETRRGSRSPRRADEAAGRARAVRGAGVARSSAEIDRRLEELRAAVDRTRTSDPRQAGSIGTHFARASASRRAKRWPRRWCSTR